MVTIATEAGKRESTGTVHSYLDCLGRLFAESESVTCVKPGRLIERTVDHLEVLLPEAEAWSYIRGIRSVLFLVDYE